MIAPSESIKAINADVVAAAEADLSMRCHGDMQRLIAAEMARRLFYSEKQDRLHELLVARRKLNAEIRKLTNEIVDEGRSILR